MLATVVSRAWGSGWGRGGAGVLCIFIGGKGGIGLGGISEVIRVIQGYHCARLGILRLFGLGDFYASPQNQ